MDPSPSFLLFLSTSISLLLSFLHNESPSTSDSLFTHVTRDDTILSTTVMTSLIPLFILLRTTQGLSYSINPPQDAFFLFSHETAKPNHTDELLYLQNDCPSSSHQSISSILGVHSSSLPIMSTLSSIQCAVAVQVVHTTARLDRPFVDVVALADVALLSFFRRPLCVAVRLTNAASATVGASCQLSPFESDRHSCLIRTQIPFAWFGAIGGNKTKQSLSLSYTIGTTCSESYLDRPQIGIHLEAHIENAQAHTLLLTQSIDVSILSRANVTLALNSLNSLFVHLSLNNTNEEWDTLELRVWLDSRIDLINVAPLSSSDWLIRASSPDRPSVHTSFLCTRLNKNTSWDGYLFALLVKMRGSVLENRRLEKKEEGEEAEFHWELRIGKGESVFKAAAFHRALMKLRVTPDSVYAIVPMTKSRQLLNTAVLSGHQTALSMRVLSITTGGSTHDVTSLSHCMSSESKVLKTSPTCASVYVDGSEMRGAISVKVHVHFDSLVTDVVFSVWYPRLPVTVWVRDAVLNAISGWPITTWKQLEGEGEARIGRSSARQFSCKERFEQTEVRILAAFQVVDERTGERSFLSGARDVLFDVTALTGDRIQTADRSIAFVRRTGQRVNVVATRRGSTSIVVKSSLPQMSLGTAALMVTDDPVTVASLTVLLVTGLSIRIDSLPGQKNIYALQSNAETSFSHKYEHGSLAVFVHYSDEHIERLEDVPIGQYSLVVQSNDDRALAVNHRAGNAVDLIALDDIPHVSLLFELRPPSDCIDHDALPLFVHTTGIRMNFGFDRSTLSVVYNVTSSPLPPPSEGWRLDTLLALLLVLFILIIAVKIVSSRARTFTGYEKLVVPLLSRLSTSMSGGRDGHCEEEENEWVWLSKPKVPSGSVGSRYSGAEKSCSLSQHSPTSPQSYDCNTQHSISYRGSEISVFISPQPAVTVNGTMADRESWRAVHSNKSARVRVSSRSRLPDSSSEHDLVRAYPSDSYSRTHTWNNGGKRPSPLNTYEGLRESIA